MYAIIEVGGFQYKVAKDQKLRIPKIDTEVGKNIDIKDVLLVVDEDTVTVGKPSVTKTTVNATVLSHGKDKKILIFKKKRRKGYKVLNGHRQQYTEIKINSIGSTQAPKQAAEEKPKSPEKVTAAPNKKPAAKPKSSEKTAAATAKKPAAKPKTVKKEEK